MAESTQTTTQRVSLAGDHEAVPLLAETFKLIGDPTRLKIILCLLETELCVHDLADLLGMSSSAVSHQLRLLRSVRIVRARKTGKYVYYALDDDHVVHLIKLSLEHIKE